MIRTKLMIPDKKKAKVIKLQPFKYQKDLFNNPILLP